MRREDKQWERLLAYLSKRGSVHRAEFGRIRLRLDGATHDVEIVMTPAEWSDMVGVAWDSFDAAAADVVRTALEAGPANRYLVYENDALEPSLEPTPPADPVDDHPDRHGEKLRLGEGWCAVDADGTKHVYRGNL